MSTRALVQGTYADYRVIKSRRVVQVVVEIPLEHGANFVSLFGMPNPGAEIPVALARLVTEAEMGEGEAPAQPERKRFRDLHPTTQAGIVCSEPSFWRFLREEHLVRCDSDGEAADFVRRYCHVKSRKDIGNTSKATAYWRHLHDRYQGWLAAPRAGVAA